MLRRRIIPFLLLDKNSDCIKTINFQERKYIGDIFNNIRIFNEKGVDEIVVLCKHIISPSPYANG